MQHYSLLIFFVIVLAISYFLNIFFLNKSKNYSIKKANTNAIRWSTQTKPVSGGITFFTVFIFSIITFFFINGKNSIDINIPLGIFIVVTLSFLMGLADDMLSSSPYFKFFIQILNSIILINFGIYINVFNNEILNYILTTLWVIGIMNSINMLDNMDSITASVSIIIFSLFLILAHSTINIFNIYILTGIISSLLIYLIFFNWSPAKMYMGDNGSQLIGSLLAIFGIIILWNHNVDNIATGKNFILILFAFAMPIIDTTTVTINRIIKGKSPFVGGKDHTTHHISYMGLSDSKVAIVFIALSIIFSVTSYIIFTLNEWNTLLTIIFSIIWLIFFSLIYLTTILFKP